MIRPGLYSGNRDAGLKLILLGYVYLVVLKTDNDGVR